MVSMNDPCSAGQSSPGSSAHTGVVPIATESRTVAYQRERIRR